MFYPGRRDNGTAGFTTHQAIAFSLLPRTFIRVPVTFVTKASLDTIQY